jgi:hypothetical protein
MIHVNTKVLHDGPIDVHSHHLHGPTISSPKSPGSSNGTPPNSTTRPFSASQGLSRRWLFRRIDPYSGTLEDVILEVFRGQLFCGLLVDPTQPNQFNFEWLGPITSCALLDLHSPSQEASRISAFFTILLSPECFLLVLQGRSFFLQANNLRQKKVFVHYVQFAQREGFGPPQPFQFLSTSDLSLFPPEATQGVPSKTYVSLVIELFGSELEVPSDCY